MSAPEPILDDMIWRCGAGMKERCCRYLIFDTTGFHCARDHYPDLAVMLRARNDMIAARLPDETYPNCQLTIQ